jgi:hypothetical protein
MIRLSSVVTVTDIILAALLIALCMGIVVFARWARLDRQYKRFRMRVSTAFIQAKCAESVNHGANDEQRVDYVTSFIGEEASDEDMARAAVYDISKRRERGDVRE